MVKSEKECVDLVLAYWRNFGMTISSCIAADLFMAPHRPTAIPGVLDFIKKLAKGDSQWAMELGREAVSHLQVMRDLERGQLCLLR